MNYRQAVRLGDASLEFIALFEGLKLSSTPFDAPLEHEDQKKNGRVGYERLDGEYVHGRWRTRPLLHAANVLESRGGSNCIRICSQHVPQSIGTPEVGILGHVWKQKIKSYAGCTMALQSPEIRS